MNDRIDRADVLIVGAGQGGALTAVTLRHQKYGGSVLLVGDEAVLPYERPALSKEYLAGEKPFDKLLLRPASFWADKMVDVRLGLRVTEIDPAAHQVRTSDGETMGYGVLVWAAGGTPRRLACSGAGVARGLHCVRHRGDVDRLRSELDTCERIAILGGGYIGLEVAAVVAKLGKKVTVIEAQDRVLARVAAEPLARFFEREHRAHGVEVLLRASVEEILTEGTPARVTGVRLAGGSVVAADLVVVGIGIDAAVGPLLAAGAEAAAGGVLVDLHGKTSLPDVYAVGDCAAHPNVHANGRVVRLESIQNANDQAMIVAKSIAGTLGAGERYDAIPWFWSNQYDLRLQTVGLWLGHDEVVVRGDPTDPATRSFSVVYLRQGSVIALDCVNHTKDYAQGKALIAGGKVVDKSKLARIDVPLKELA